MTEYNNFGLFYKAKDGKIYLYKSCNTEEMIAHIIKNDIEFKKIDVEDVFVIKLNDTVKEKL